MILIRWDPTKPADFGNLICMTKSEARKHEMLDPTAFQKEYSDEQLDYIHERFEKESLIRKWR
jgi:tRNA threonylcarbamoyladenosine dehydratase